MYKKYWLFVFSKIFTFVQPTLLVPINITLKHAINKMPIQLASGRQRIATWANRPFKETFTGTEPYTEGNLSYIKLNFIQYIVLKCQLLKKIKTTFIKNIR